MVPGARAPRRIEADRIGQGLTDETTAVSYTGRLFAILEALVREGGPVGPRPLSRISGVERNSTARVLRNLEEIGVVASHDGAYSLTARFFDLCRAGVTLDGTSNIIAPFVERLVRESGESAAAFRRAGDLVVPVYMVETDKTIRYVSDYDTLLPLHAGSPGRAILSTLPDAEIEAFLERTDLVRMTSHTITDPTRLWRQVLRTRKDGVCWSNAEAVDGGWGVAAPYFHRDGRGVGALSVLGPLSRPPSDKARLARIVQETAAELSTRLGHSGS
jgi:IclR family pca regulon transcriptional regulator